MGAGLIEVSALILAVVAAARSTWSPCGLSMLSTITPLGERARGHRYPVTVSWFLVGALLGGATFGGLMAAAAALIGLSTPSAQAAAVVLLLAAGVTVAADLHVGGFRLPTIPRQVDETWTGRYRSWVYAAAFGWQIGVGLTTYVMTAAVYLVIVAAALTGDAGAAFAVGLVFGAVRGSAVFLGFRLRSPSALRRFHRRFEAAAPCSLAVAIAAQVTVAAVAAAAAGEIAVLAVSVVALFVLAMKLHESGAQRAAGSTDGQRRNPVTGGRVGTAGTGHHGAMPQVVE
jgi:hypothetical protein